MHILKYSEWENGGRWYTNDIEDIVKSHPYWWYAKNVLNLSATDFVLLLRDKFNASHFFYQNDVLVYSFDTQEQARKFKNYINAAARKMNYII